MNRPAPHLLLLGATVGAITLVALSVQVNLARLCAPAAPDELCGTPTAGRAEALRRHITANPGASDAYVRLVAMKLFALRASDYMRSASREDRRYLLFKRLISARETREFGASRTDLVLVAIVGLLGVCMTVYVIAQAVL